MQANGTQLRQLAPLYDAGPLRPLIDSKTIITLD